MSAFAIIGAGNAGCAFAAHLKLLGHETRLFDVIPEQLKGIQDGGNTLRLEGNLPVQGEAKIDLVTDDIAAAIEGVDLIMCTAPAHFHRAVAKELAPHLGPGQIVMLNPGRTCGALEVQQVISGSGGPEDVLVVEAQTLVYACRRTGCDVHIFGVKDRVACAGLPAEKMGRFFEIIQCVLPQFVPAAQGIWETSLDNIGMLFHPAPTMMNLGRMETGEPFDYYIDGMSPTVTGLIEKLDVERCAVAKAMGISVPTAVEWLKASYGAEGSNLFEAIHNNEAYAGIKAPRLNGIEAKMQLRYVVEDVPSGLVPVAELGRVFGVPTPTMNLVIDLANTLFDRDFRQSGRTLDRLGLAEMSPEEIRNL